MNYVKRMVCLANSRKHSGRCIAGKEVLENGYGPWIRPVSARPSAEVSEEERRYENGQSPRILDIIDVPIIGAAPLLHQTENHIIDGDYYWIKRGELPWGELRRLVDEPQILWPNGDSTYYGLNDRVTLQTASKITDSLVLIQPASLSVHVQTEGAEFATREEGFGRPSRTGEQTTSLSLRTQSRSRRFQANRMGNIAWMKTTFVSASERLIQTTIAISSWLRLS